MVENKERLVTLNLGDLESMEKDLSLLTDGDLENLSHLLSVLSIKREHCPKKQRSFFQEFDDIYMGDFYIEGDVVTQVNSEIRDLRTHADLGSVERVFYLVRWLNTKFNK